MGCYNRDTAEYKALQKKFKNNILIDILIEKWQDSNNSDQIPNANQLKNVVDDSKVNYSLKTRKYKDAIMANLSRKKLISKYYDKYYVNTVSKDSKDKTKGDFRTLKNNLSLATSWLTLWGVPQESIITRKTKNSYEIDVDDNLFTPNDILTKSQAKNATHAARVLEHLNRMFPQVSYDVVSVKEAKDYYDQLPKWRKSTVPFKEIKSYVVDNKAKIIEGRVDIDTAIEEILHPFVDAIQKENSQLYDSLLSEAEKTFPKLKQEIDDSYTDIRRFNNNDRNQELVTQALARTFSREFEDQPTISWKDKVREVIKFLLDVIKDLHNYITGNNLKLKVGMINANTSLSDIAKLLNTDQLEFTFQEETVVSTAQEKVKYSLTPRALRIYKQAVAKANPLQKPIVQKLFHQAYQSDKVFGLTGAPFVTGTNSPLVILDKKTHTYKNVEAPNQNWNSVTSLFKGFMLQKYLIKPGQTIDDVVVATGFSKEEIIDVNPKEWDIENLTANNIRLKQIFIPESRFQLQRDLGNDFDILMESVITFQPFDEIDDSFSVLSEEQARRTHEDLQSIIAEEMPNEGTIYLPQVVVANPDPLNKIAGTIDILRIDKSGVMSIIDLKTSGNSIAAGTYDKAYPVNYGSALFDPSITDITKQVSLSTRGQHGMQVNMYSRILENMGYRVNKDNNQTYHINLEYIGKEGEKKYVDKWNAEGFVLHPPSINQDYVNKLIPKLVDPLSVEQLDKIRIDTGDIEAELDPEILGPEEGIEETIDDHWRVYFTGLVEYKGVLQRSRDVLETMDDRRGLLKSKEELLNNIDSATTAINIALEETGDVLPVYSSLLRGVRDDMKEFIEYVNDPETVKDNDYIARVMNIQRYARGWTNLANIGKGEGLSKDMLLLQKEVLNLISDIMGITTEDGVVIKQGLITEALFDFVEDIVYKETINPEYKADRDLVKELVKHGTDMGVIESLTGDLSTSRDALGQIMVKIYKRKKQEVQDKIQTRVTDIKKSAYNLLQEQKKAGVKESFDFMYQFDSDGNFTGEEVKKRGEGYNKINRKRYADLSDEEGNWRYYNKVGEDKKELTKRDRDENKDLYQKKQKWKNFKKAEQVIDDQIVDGDYHRYTQEFKDARRQFEEPKIITLSNGEKFIRWEKKLGVNRASYDRYKVKYYNSDTYDRPILENGEFTGMTIEDVGSWPKLKYTEVRETSRGGETNDLVDPKYAKLMGTPNTALEAAEKDFFNAYMKHKEELMDLIPASQRHKIEGKSFAIMDSVSEQLQKQPNWFVSAWADMKSYASSWFKPEMWTNVEARVKFNNEDGELVDTLPLFYLGSARTEGAMEKLYAKRRANKADWDAGKISKKEYKERRQEINESLKRLHDVPTKKEMSRNAAQNLMMFAGMAENYEVMSNIEDTMKAFVKVVQRRTYEQSDYKIVNTAKKWANKIRGIKGGSVFESRVKKWMKMTYYDNDKATKKWYDHASNFAISLSSLTYVAFAPFGNFNNYMVGRLSNAIEAAGASFFCRECYLRAVKEQNVKGYAGVVIDMAKNNKSVGERLKAYTAKDFKELPVHSKFQAMVDLFRMMDAQADIREQTMATKGSGRKSLRERLSWGYALQDAAEWNVQTKVGVAILMSHKLENSKTGDQLSLYDALTYDRNTGEIKAKDGYDTLVEYHTGNKRQWNDDARRDVRNYIREVNKQIHGNYAYEDRMAMQSHALGQLLAQFHKWIAPVFKRRFRGAYYDENVGWIEGRYRTLWSFLAHSTEVLLGVNKQKGRVRKKIWDFWSEGQGPNSVNKARIRKQNMIGNMMDVSLVLLSLITANLLDAVWDDEDDDKSVVRKRLENALLYQLRRQASEFALWYPGIGISEVMKMTQSPIASSRYMAELIDATMKTVYIPAISLGMTKEERMLDKRIYYQRGDRKGQPKLLKEWGDVTPWFYTINRFKSYDTVKDFNPMN